MSDNKLVKTIMDAATLTGLAAGIGWASKKVLKEDVAANPSTNVMNYVKFTTVMAASIAAKDYAAATRRFVFFELLWHLNNGCQALQNILQPSGLLERHHRYQKISRSRTCT